MYEIISLTKTKSAWDKEPTDFKYEIRVYNWGGKVIRPHYTNDVSLAMDYADKLCIMYGASVEVFLITSHDGRSIEYEASPLTAYVEHDMAHRAAYYALPESQQLPDYF